MDLALACPGLSAVGSLPCSRCPLPLDLPAVRTVARWLVLVPEEDVDGRGRCCPRSTCPPTCLLTTCCCYLTLPPYLDLPPKHQSAWIVNLQPPQKSITRGSPRRRDGDRPLPAISLSSPYIGRRAPGLRPQVWHFAHPAASPSAPSNPLSPNSQSRLLLGQK